jgi:class 3 adenylate cyclase
MQPVPEQRTVALLTTDIVGFTALSAAIGPDEVVEMLDACVGSAAACCARNPMLAKNISCVRACASLFVLQVIL